MKKRAAMVIAVALTAAIAFTACGNNPAPAAESGGTSSVAESVSVSESEPESEAASESETAAPQSEESTTEADEETGSNDIAVFAAEMQAMLDALSEFYGDALTIETSTQGDNTLIITYTLLSGDLGLNAENIAESMKTEGSKMEDLALQMGEGGISSPVVVVKWIDIDGTELFNQEYK